MRTTLTLEDDLAAELKQLAYQRDVSFKQVVNETLRAGLVAAGAAPRAKQYRIEPAAMGAPRPGIDLVRSLRLADELENEAILDEIEARR